MFAHCISAECIVRLFKGGGGGGGIAAAQQTLTRDQTFEEVAKPTGARSAAKPIFGRKIEFTEKACTFFNIVQ